MPGGHATSHAHHGSDAYELGVEPDGGEAGAFLNFTTPNDVIDEKNRIQAKFASVRSDVLSCAALSKEQKAAFADFYLAWRKFFCDNDTGDCATPGWHLFGTAGQLEQAHTYEEQLFDWQNIVASSNCKLSAPATPPPSEAPNLQSLAKWVAIGALAVGAIYVTSKTGLPRLWGKGRAK